MKHSNYSPATAEDPGRIYTAFLRLEREDRRSVALRILGNQRLLRDLYDHFLIQRAISEKGRSVALEDCRRLPKRLAS